MELAIISDLHCHALVDFPDRRAESFLVADSPRVPIGRHPVQALIHLIRTNNMKVDAVLCPGDLAHKASNIGLHASLSGVKEIASEFGSKHLLISIGNHDVASRPPSGDPFETLKTLHPDFPCRDDNSRNQYWTDGFYIHSIGPSLDVIVINTSHHHYSESEARHGTFPEPQLERLRDRLASLPASSRVGLLHHHPILHSAAGFESSDVLPNGDRLLECLFSHGCKFVVHGHRHLARIQRYSANDKHGFVFAAGSFSAHLNEIGTHTANLFHVVSLDVGAEEMTGSIRSWEYNYCLGWKPTSVDGGGMPHVATFGAPPPVGWKDNIAADLVSRRNALTRRVELNERYPYLLTCIPDEIESLSERLRSAGLQVYSGPDEHLAVVVS